MPNLPTTPVLVSQLVGASGVSPLHKILQGPFSICFHVQWDKFFLNFIHKFIVVHIHIQVFNLWWIQKQPVIQPLVPSVHHTDEPQLG